MSFIKQATIGQDQCNVIFYKDFFFTLAIDILTTAVLSQSKAGAKAKARDQKEVKWKLNNHANLKIPE